MKIYIICIVIFGLGFGASCQTDSSWTEECWKIRAEYVAAQRIRMHKVDTCKQISAIEDRIPGHFGLTDGLYELFGDPDFKRLRLAGYYFQSFPVGIWHEYYANGNYKYEGFCKLLSFGLLRNKKGQLDTIYVVDESMPMDTAKIKLSKQALNNFQKLHTYSPGSEGHLLSEISGFPSHEDVKSGKWIYYGEDGTVARIEYYSNGRLLKVENKNSDKGK
jgi:hypothetical protein